MGHLKSVVCLFALTGCGTVGGVASDLAQPKKEEVAQMTTPRRPPTRGMEVIERVYRGELKAYKRTADLVSSDRRKKLISCYDHMKLSALELALSSYFLGKDGEVIPWLKKSAEAGIGLFGLAGTSWVEITNLGEDGMPVSTERREDTSLTNLGEYKALAEAGLMIGDKTILTRIGDIDCRAFMRSSTMSTDPERYEETKLLRLLCRGEEEKAKTLLSSWDGRETVAELKSFGVGDDPEMPALNPWTGYKPPRTRCLEAILLSDSEALAAALKDLLAEHRKERRLMAGLTPEEICVPAVCVSVMAKRCGLSVKVKDKYLPEGLVDILLRGTRGQPEKH